MILIYILTYANSFLYCFNKNPLISFLTDVQVRPDITKLSWAILSTYLTECNFHLKRLIDPLRKRRIYL